MSVFVRPSLIYVMIDIEMSIYILESYECKPVNKFLGLYAHVLPELAGLGNKLVWALVSENMTNLIVMEFPTRVETNRP